MHSKKHRTAVTLSSFEIKSPYNDRVLVKQGCDDRDCDECLFTWCISKAVEGGTRESSTTVGKRESHINRFMVRPTKVAPVTGTTFRTTDPVPADSRYAIA